MITVIQTQYVDTIRYFKAILDADQTKYRGTDPTTAYAMPVSIAITDHLQVEIDSLLDMDAAMLGPSNVNTGQ